MPLADGRLDDPVQRGGGEVALPAAHRRLDVFVEGELPPDPGELDRFGRGRQCLVVLAGAVAEGGPRPERGLQAESDVADAGGFDLLVDSLRGVVGRFEARHDGLRRRHEVASGRTEDLGRLADRGCGGIEVAFEQERPGPAC